MEMKYIYCHKCGEKNKAVNTNCKKCSYLLGGNTSRTNQSFIAQQNSVPEYQPSFTPKRKMHGCLIAIIVCVALFISFIVFIIAIGAIFGEDEFTDFTIEEQVVSIAPDDTLSESDFAEQVATQSISAQSENTQT